METRTREINSRQNSKISIRVTPGHFATRHSHINTYIDMTRIKSQHTIAGLAGGELARFYSRQVPVDAIVCLDGMEVVAAYMAKELSENDSRSLSVGAAISILTPEMNHSGQLMLRDNLQSLIWNRQCLLLVASATTGNTIRQAADCIAYYSGKVCGVCALFSAISKVDSHEVKSVFSVQDIPDYKTWSPAECPDCREHHKIDALVNSFGYSRL